MSTHVELGFLETCESWKLLSNHFPSKIGGKPAWLDLESIPSDIECLLCKDPMSFFVQIYAPYEEREDCFHRIIYVFVCRKESCNVKNDSSNIIVYRNQLARINKFYSSDPPAESPDSTFNINDFIKLCAVCGCFGSKKCSKCQSINYCSRSHQVIDWKNGHKSICAQNLDIQTTSPASGQILFSEYEIVTEPEEIEEVSQQETEAEAEERRMAEFKKLSNEGKIGSMVEMSESDLLAYSICKEDEVFLKFKKHIDHYPDQILRYGRGTSPLWIAENPKLDLKDVPNCQYCGEQRQFEFQLLPQVLYQLKETNFDFGVLVVYTCINSCNDGPAYKKEYIYKQDVSNE